MRSRFGTKMTYPAVFGLLLMAFFSLNAFTGQKADPPAQFDLRNYNGENYVTSVKSQTGGTCWTHGAMAAIESNMLMTGAWTAAGEADEPNLAEYHLDWWNGFNQNNNDDTDPPTGGGLVVHEGGDYRVTSAYLTRGEGAVRDIDGQSYSTPPARYDDSYHYFYVPHIEWYTAETDLSRINTIKQKVMDYGLVGTCLCYDGSFLDGSYNHYQPPTSPLDPNHAVGIVGWDDNRVTQAPQPGAWLIKNSWGESWGYNGYFWISYYDKHAGQHPEMGAISFQDAGPMPYDKFYYHDYHGWRNTLTEYGQAFNAFIAGGYEYGAEFLDAVSFFTAADSVNYTVVIYDSFDGSTLSDELATRSGFFEFTGFHTVTLDSPLELAAGNDFYVYVDFSAGGQPYDQTSDVPVLLGARYRTIVESSSQPGQSYYYDGMQWQDLYNLDTTANFCLKALAVYEDYLNIDVPDGTPEYVNPGESTSFNVEIIGGVEPYVPGSGTLHYRFESGEFETLPLVHIDGDMYQAILPPAECGSTPEYYVSAEGLDRTTVHCPKDAPATLFTSLVGEKADYFRDNFETDLGWTTSAAGATSGYWQRGVPVNDPGWDYDPEADADGSGQCWLTYNIIGNTDVDDGSVTLISPVIDMSGRSGNIEYYYYLYLTNTDGGVDRLLVEINDGTSGWVEIARHDTDGGLYWRYHIITAAEIKAAGATFTSTMQVRFNANDANPQSIVEAGVDDFGIAYLLCENPYICGDLDGNETVNLLDIVYLIAYLYQSGPPPAIMNTADVNNDGAVNLIDITSMINHLYQGGPELICP